MTLSLAATVEIPS